MNFVNVKRFYSRRKSNFFSDYNTLRQENFYVIPDLCYIYVNGARSLKGGIPILKMSQMDLRLM